MSERLKGNLKRRAAAWAGNLTKLAKSLAPNHVRPAISSHVETKSDGTYIIRITASRRIAPDARAQEYGSGLHARRGVRQKYPILPKNKKVLAFFWEKAYPEIPTLPDGRVMLASVQHPGIEAANSGAGYIAPAVKEIRKRIPQELLIDINDAVRNDIGQALRGEIRTSFGRK